MKKKLLLTLVFVLAITAALNAQDQQQTAAPTIIEDYGNRIFSEPNGNDSKDFFQHSAIYIAWIVNNDECDVTIYYRHDSSDWNEYNGGEIYSHDLNGAFETVEAYAVAEGKQPSEIVRAELELFNRTDYLYSTCLVDGIHYYFYDYSLVDHSIIFPAIEEVSVTSKKESEIYSPPYSGDIVIPSEITIYDDTYPVTVTGIRPLAFASTFNYSCDITSVELPSTIREIESSAFAGCTQLESMIIHAVQPPYAYRLFEYEYGDENYGYYNYIGFDWSQLYNQVTLYVPNESLEDYRAHAEWGRFERIVPFIGTGPGDIDGDGSIDVSDVTTIIGMILDTQEIPAYADMDGDGVVDVGDVTLLINRILNQH